MDMNHGEPIEKCLAFFKDSSDNESDPVESLEPHQDTMAVYIGYKVCDTLRDAGSRGTDCMARAADSNATSNSRSYAEGAVSADIATYSSRVGAGL